MSIITHNSQELVFPEGKIILLDGRILDCYPAADILAEKDGITYAVQCKCYDKPIGVKAVQEVYAGRDYYDRMVGVVMTNQYFTQPAVELARKLNIMLWDRGYLDDMDKAE